MADATAFSLSAGGTFNLIFGFSLSALISPLLVLQLMVYPVGFDLKYPVNFLRTAGALIWIVAFDVFPSEDINKEFLEFTGTKSFSEGLAILLHDGINFALSVGSCLIFFYILIGLIIIYVLIYLANKICKCKCLTKMKTCLSNQLFWNRFIDFLKVGMIEFLLSCLVQVK